MFGILVVQLLLLAPVIASEANVSQLVENQGTGAEKLTMVKTVVTAQANTLGEAVTERSGEMASHVATKQPSEDELPFMPVSWIQTGADAQQVAEAAAAHRAQMWAGLERMSKNLESVEQASDAI